MIAGCRIAGPGPVALRLRCAGECAGEPCGETRGLRKADRGILPEAWLCGDHWNVVPAESAAAYRELQRRARRYDDRGDALPHGLEAALDVAWARCVAAARLEREAA